MEIQSVNRKFLEVQVTLPPELFSFEVDIKRWVSERVGRGSLTVRVNGAFQEATPLHLQANLPIVRQIRQAAQTIAVECGLSDLETLTRELVVRNRDVLATLSQEEELEAYREVLKEAVKEALDHLIQMKEVEGRTLEADMLERVALLEQGVAIIEAQAPTSAERFKNKLREKVEEVLSGSLENEERILREVCVYSEKVDITEEVVRFRHHIQQLKQLLSGKELAQGKKIDFTMQELNREITTIASKSSEVEISQQVVTIKSEIERIREQIQNVE